MSSAPGNVEVITIDGPAGAGKSTVARRVARRLGYAFLDTGAMYRAATWRAMNAGVDLTNRDELIRSTGLMSLAMADDRILVDGKDITEAIRSPEVTRSIRMLDGIPEIREQLGAMQRRIGCSRPTIAEGRDMGTVIFPDAATKIFLEAGIEARAKRRAEEMQAQGVEVTVADVMVDIENRDKNDRTRETSPLRAAKDAHRIDTSEMGIEEVVDRIVDLALKDNNRAP